MKASKRTNKQTNEKIERRKQETKQFSKPPMPPKHETARNKIHLFCRVLFFRRGTPEKTLENNFWKKHLKFDPLSGPLMNLAPGL